MMLFYKYVCDYILENIATSQLIAIAMECITDGMESENLFILAGLSEKFDYNYIELYFKLTLKELNINEPNQKEAAEYLTYFYCKELIDKKISPKLFLEKIYDIHVSVREYYYDEGNVLGIKNILRIYYALEERYDIWLYIQTETDDKEKKRYNKIYEQDKIKFYKQCYREVEQYLKIH